jgi:S1-C subfamily serine protease
MNLLDVIIILLLISAVYRGYELGLTRQLFSTVGFFFGLFLGSFLQRFTIQLVHTPISKALVALMTTLGLAFFFLGIGEQVGLRLRDTVTRWKLGKADGVSGSILAGVTLLVTVWLAAAILLTLPLKNTQEQIRGSAIISRLNGSLPPATSVLTGLGHLINPNGFPQVFTGNEPALEGNTTVPGISPQLQAAINKDKVSVVKFEGIGCGGIVNGSGFVVDSDLVATNAHVVAGVSRVYVRDGNGQHTGTVVWFDPELDFAVVRVDNLAGPPLLIKDGLVPNDTKGAVLGYPGGGPLTAGGALVLDPFIARGRDIYNHSVTEREIYSLAAHVIPGNSGGPVIAEDGTVFGVVFAESTTYDNVGYALTTSQIQSAVAQARAQARAVSNGSCAE